MLRRRIIPCLDVSGGRVVKGVEFVNLRDCGEPVDAALRYADQGADEICWLNITAGDEAWHELLAQVEQAGTRIDVPLTVGGGISDEPHVRDLLEGKKSAFRDIVCFNSGAALVVAGKAKDVRDGAGQAATSIDGGKAKAALQQLVAITNTPPSLAAPAE